MPEGGEADMEGYEKVIKGLQAHETGCGYRSHHCDDMDCPYRYGDESCDIEEMCHDALELLKEYAAIKETLSNEIHETAKMFRREG